MAMFGLCRRNERKARQPDRGTDLRLLNSRQLIFDRVAISNHRILDVAEGNVTFR